MPDALDEAFSDYLKEHGPSTPPPTAATGTWLIFAAVATGLAMLAPLSMMLFWRRVSSTTPPAEEEAPAGADAPAGAPGAAKKPKEKYRTSQELRDTLDGAALVVEAGKKKEQANQLLKLDLPEPAMQIYLSGIWLLKVGRPPYPQVLSGQQPPRDEMAAALLGSGMGAEPLEKREPGLWAAVKAGATKAWRDREARRAPPDSLYGEEAEAMRRALHLNVAAVALKIDDFYLAREACKYVLAKQPTNAKALYRLAQAYDGARDPRAALKALTTLIKAEPQNREARAMWERLKVQTLEEKSFFKGIASKAKEGYGLGSTDAAPAPEHAEVEDEMTQRIRALLEHEEDEKERAAAKAAEEAAMAGMPQTAQEKMREKADAARADADAAATAEAIEAQPAAVAK